MGTIIGKLLDWLFGKSPRERDGAIFYFKSLMFLILIVIFVSNKFWNMSDSIKNLLNENAITYIVEISNIGVHFFTSLAIISLGVVIVAAIIRVIAGKYFDKYENYFNRMRIGAEFRLSNSAEDILLFLMIAYIFDKNVLQNYISIYSNCMFIILGLICVFEFFTSSVKGIINRFFMLIPYDYFLLGTL